MLLDAEMDNTQSDEVVVSVITVLLRGAKHSPEILKQAIELLRDECADIAGFITGEVLVGHDVRSLALVSEWSNRHAWAVSRYDARVGNMLEVCFANATALDFRLYYRSARFVAARRVEASS